VAIGREIDAALLIPEVQGIEPAAGDSVPAEGVILRLQGAAFLKRLLEQSQSLRRM
jgi:hypothetical protein